METGANNAIYLRAPAGRVLSDYSNGTLYDYAHDILGSVTGLIATDGTLAGSYTYDPWGNADGTTPTAYNPIQFTGQYLDGGTGLYQMNARFYQPGSGRFTQLDPLPKNLLTGNRYEYAGCSPTNRVDPSGRDWWCIVNVMVFGISVATLTLSFASLPVVPELAIFLIVGSLIGVIWGAITSIKCILVAEGLY